MSASMELRRDPLPTASHLSGDEVARLRSVLTDALAERRAQVDDSARLAATLGAEGTADGTVLDREVARLVAERARDALADVERALARIDDGTYGMCESCAQPIPYERLEAIPTTPFCVDCPRTGGLIG
jgi:RNA polymerase-binding transcription factor DksA